MPFPAASPGASTFIDLIAPSVAGGHAQRRAARPGRRISTARGSPARARPSRTSWWSRRRRIYMNTGEGLHRFVDPVDGEVYLYTQFEVAGHATDVRRLRAARPQGDLRLHRHGAGALAGRLVLPHPEPTPPAPRRRAARPGRSRPPRGCPSYITALVAGPYAVVHDEVASGKDGAAGHLLPSVAAGAPRRRRTSSTAPSAVSSSSSGSSTAAYPFEKYDQLFTPEYNMGAMENAGCVTINEVYVFRAKVTEPLVERRALTHPARARAHVVRRPRDDAVVERPVAQRVVRRVGVDHCQAEATQWRPPGRRSSAARSPGPTARTSCPPPTRSYADIRDLEDVAGQLRRHHLRQGRLGPQAARRLRRHRAVHRGTARLLRQARLGQHHARGPARPSSRATSGRDLGRGPSCGWRPPGSTPCSSDGRDRRRRAGHVGGRRADGGRRGSRRCGRTGSRSAATSCSDGQLVRVGRHELDVDGAAHRACRSWSGVPPPDLLLLNDDDLAYAKIRFDDRSYATALAHPRGLRREPARGRWSSAPLWEMVRGRPRCPAATSSSCSWRRSRPRRTRR